MAGTSVDVELKGYEEVMLFFHRASNPELLTFAEFTGEHMMGVAGQAFEDHVDPATGEPWPEKSDGSEATLYLSGSMSRNTSYEAYPDGSMLLGNIKVYSRTHQEGRTEDGIPSRPFLGYNDAIVRDMMDDPAIKEIFLS